MPQLVGTVSWNRKQPTDSPKRQQISNDFTATICEDVIDHKADRDGRLPGGDVGSGGHMKYAGIG